jgi:tRNA(Ile)-lysidine synthase
MNRDLSQRVLATIRRHAMMRPGDRIGAGVSGGADSVALLHLLAQLRAKLGIGILVLHFHHQLRGTQADEDERFVQALAAEFQFEFVSGRADVAGEARRNGWNLEDAGRRLRYQFFDSAAAERKLDRVAVAHTEEDQAETVLAHLLRGTGVTGLAGIYPVAGLIVRPLLEIGRGELREYLTGLQRPWREDASNQDTSRMRARIRHQLLPILRRDFEASSVTRLARLAGLAREEEMFWRSLEDERFAALTVHEPSGDLSVRIADLLFPLPLLAHPENVGNGDSGSPRASMLALSRRLVRRIIAGLLGSRTQLTARHVQDVLDLAENSHSGARIELPGIVVERTFDRVVFSAAAAARAKGVWEQEGSRREFEYSISLSNLAGTSRIVVPEIQRRFDLKVIDWPSASRETVILYGSALDFDRLRCPLILRNWRPGDSYRPCGRRRVRKLKRLFLESRVPRNRRATWPVLTSAGQLVWASGYPVAEEFAPDSGTRTGLVIAEERFPCSAAKR